MKAQAHSADCSSFFDHLRSTASRILLVDYDGTLAPFRTDREHAAPYPAVSPLLGQIIESGTRVLLISGRPARELASLCGIQPRPEIWGSHGLERLRPDGSYELDPISPEQEAGLLQATEHMRVNGLGKRTEVKPGSVALHWRGTDEAEASAMRNKAHELWTPLLEPHSLHLLDFDGGLEIRINGQDKGKAVATILRESPTEAAIAYLGDDYTDEDAFRALRGRGLSILVRAEFRPTIADLWLQPPHQLIEFFDDWLVSTAVPEKKT